MRRIVLAALVALSLSTPAWDHAWYPMECCHELDCAPVDKVEREEANKGAWMTTKHGTVWVPDTFEAHHRVKDLDDGRKEKIYTVPPPTEPQGLHVCMRRSFTYGTDPGRQKGPELVPMRIICLFREGGT